MRTIVKLCALYCKMFLVIRRKGASMRKLGRAAQGNPACTVIYLNITPYFFYKTYARDDIVARRAFQNKYGVFVVSFDTA